MAELKDKVVTLECLKAVHEKDAQTIEQTQEELTATKEELSNTKTALATTQEDLKKAQRAIQFQAKLTQGQVWDFETDTKEAYQLQVPSGAKAGAVMAVGGKTVGWNQLASIKTAASTDYNFLNVKIPTSAFRLTHKYYFGDTATESDGTAFTFTTAGFWNATMDKYLRVETTGIRKNGKSAIVASWSALPEGVTADDLTYIVFQYIGANSAADSRVSAQDLTVIDLTLLYGPGNEPADTSDPRIAQIEAYAAAHPESNAGELLSALVDEVRVRGKNLVSAYVPDITSHGVAINGNGDGTYTVNGTASDGLADFYSKKFKLVKGKQYKIVGTPPGGTLATYYSYIRNSGGWAQYVAEASGSIFTADFDEYITGFNVKKGISANNIIWRPMVTEKTDATYEDYSPYHEDLYLIPSAVQALPGYGWSAGSVANTVERTDNGWQYVQRVGCVDLGTLDWYDGGLERVPGVWSLGNRLTM